jgi:regulator of RNase E activity RraA
MSAPLSTPEPSSTEPVVAGRTFAELAEEVRTALVADALDAAGLRHQCLSPGIVPLRRGAVVIGRAFPVRIAAVQAVPEIPYVRLLESLDAIGPGDVFVAATGGLPDVAIWGELIATACLHRGAIASVCDGYARDTAILRTMGFPVFARGAVPYDSNGRSEVVSYGLPVEIDGVTINHGDLIVADDDGVVIVPEDLAEEILAAALAKNAGESQFRRAVRSGMSATEAFRTYGVL